MYCNKCGASLPDGTKFCNMCGSGTESGGFAQGAAPNYYSGASAPQPLNNPYGGAPQANPYGQPYGYQYPVKKKGGCLKWIIIVGCIILALTLIIVFVVNMLDSRFGGGSGLSGYNASQNGYANGFNYSVNYDYTLGGVGGEPVSISGLREKYTDTEGAGSVTVMIYMVASDLESNGGFATSDLGEMEDAVIGGNCNVVIQTGGTSYWNNSLMTNGTCERWLLQDDGFVLLDDIGQRNMTAPESLAEFIQYSAAAYPADRYCLILWDHGGGTMWGYGYDENYPNDAMDIRELDNALTSGGVKFDFVGFDACLMSTVEVAFVMENHADYLIASEESEPGCGWHYSNWLTALSEDSSIDTVDLSKILIDDFVRECSALDYEAEATLAIVDLCEIPYTYDMLCNFLDDSKNELNNYRYDTVSRARNDARGYGEGKYQQIDIADLAYRLSVDNADELIAAVKSAVKYRNQTDNMRGSHGLAMYFPYTDYEYYNYVSDLERSIGIATNTQAFSTYFLTP